MTKLKAIIDFLREKRIKNMKKWSDRFLALRNGNKSWYIKKITKDIKMILNILSGFDPMEMIKSIYSKKEVEKIVPMKYKACLNNLSEYYNKMPLKQRYKFIREIKKANFKYFEVRKFGYEISRKLWKTCLNENERKKGGGVSIPLSIKNSLNSYFKQNSNIMANRMVTLKDEQTSKKILKPVRILTNSKLELYKSFPYKLSRSTFYKYLKQSRIFKKSQRLTDLCSYCEDGLRLKKKLSSIFKNDLIEWDDVFNIKRLIQRQEIICIDLQKNIENIDRFGRTSDQNVDHLHEQFIHNKKILIHLKDYEVICFHKNIARCQRDAYNNQRKNIHELKNKLLIEVDFKQKIIIGMGPRQVSSEFYEQTQRSCLGFGIYYLLEDNSIRKINFDIISHDLTQDAQAAVRGFRLLREHEFFKSIDTKNYNVWTDVGPHFRNHIFVGYLLKELRDQKIHVNLNYFLDKHGKNTRDAHFSNVSRFVKQQSLLKELKTSEDIVNAINIGTQKANENKKDQTITFAVVLDEKVNEALQARYPNYKSLEIQNICSYYNYRTVGQDFKLMTSILSKDDRCMNLVLKTNKEQIEKYRVMEKEEVQKPDDLTYTTLASKKMRISSAISQIKENLHVHSLDNNNNHNNNNNNIPLEKRSNDMQGPTFTESFHGELMSEYYTYFSMEPDEEIIIENDLKQKPEFCKDKNQGKKASCLSCKASCKYTLKMLMDPISPIGQELILNELMAHGHPSSRRMPNGFQRLTKEAEQELVDHYIYSHNKKRPNFVINFDIEPVNTGRQDNQINTKKLKTLKKKPSKLQ